MNFFGRKRTEDHIKQISDKVDLSEKLEIPIRSGINTHNIYSPTSGKIIPLQQVNDEVFKNEIVGKGIAILPDVPAIYSPVNGIVKYLPKTNHAILIQSEDGIQVLVHIGLDTVNLKGQFFNPFVHKNDKVKKGELLIKFDLNAITSKGYSIVIPVVITNSNEYSRIELTQKEIICISDCLISLFK